MGQSEEARTGRTSSADYATFKERSNPERDLSDLIARGHPKPDIPELLVLSPKTVRNHVANILNLSWRRRPEPQVIYTVTRGVPGLRMASARRKWSTQRAAGRPCRVQS